MVTEKDLPAARSYADTALTRWQQNPALRCIEEVVEGAYLDGLEAGRSEQDVGYLQGGIDEADQIVAFIRRKVEEGRASLAAKNVNGFLRSVWLEHAEVFTDLADAIERGEHVAVA